MTSIQTSSTNNSSDRPNVDPVSKPSKQATVETPVRLNSDPETKDESLVVEIDNTSNTDYKNTDPGISQSIPRDLDSTLEKEWPHIIKALSRVKARRFNMGALLRDCKNVNLDGNILRLGFSNKSNMERFSDEIDNPESKRSLISTIFDIARANLVDISCYLLDREEHAKHPKDNALVQATINLGGQIVEEREESPQ